MEISEQEFQAATLRGEEVRRGSRRLDAGAGRRARGSGGANEREGGWSGRRDAVDRPGGAPEDGAGGLRPRLILGARLPVRESPGGRADPRRLCRRQGHMVCGVYHSAHGVNLCWIFNNVLFP